MGYLKRVRWKLAERFSALFNSLDDSEILCKGSIFARKGENVVILAKYARRAYLVW